MFERAHHRQVPTTHDEVSEARFKRFLQDLRAYEEHAAFDATRDAFLDLYSAWLKTHEPWMKIQVVMLAFELHRLNPEFQFDLTFAD